MCGILAWIGHGEEVRPEADRALARLATRGPDGRAIWIDPATRIGLGNARLAILDTRPDAGQPMQRADLRVTHNGEIYNFVELRAELVERGQRFATGSDTEVLLAAYRMWGEDALARFNGMWAFALWDPARNAILLSRDRLGVKPLFLARGAACVHVASELKALLAFSCLRWSPDVERLRSFITTGATLDGSRATLFSGIERVPPASVVWLDARTGESTERRFWDLVPTPGLSRLGLEEAAARFDELFSDAVRIRLRSDVPVGLTLSGGVDSSTIAVKLSQLPAASPPVRAFSVRWPSPRLDEGPLIDQVLKATGIDGASVIATPEDLPAVVERFVWHQDEPPAHTAAFGQWLVYALAARSGVHVVLEGQGADELFGGYHAMAFGAHFGALIRAGDVAGLTAELRAFRRVQGQSAARGLAYAALAAPPQRARATMRQLRWRSLLLGRGAPLPAPDVGVASVGGLHGALAEALLVSSLPPLLRYADRSSMAHSVEVRLPFLDHRIVAFAFGLAPGLLVGAGSTKRVLRTALRSRLPQIADRSGKLGFTAPESEWIRGPLRGWIGELVLAADSRGMFPKDAAARTWSAVRSGRAPAQVAWRVAIGELWLRRYLDGGGHPPA